MLGHMPEEILAPVDYNSPKALSALLNSMGYSMQKRFGQNFLINRDAREKLIKLLDVQKGSSTWEIGPGTGSMSYELLKDGHSLTVFEIDRGFSRFLEEQFGAIPGFRLHEGDFVKTWSSIAPEIEKPARIFGNLPYNAAGAIIASIIEGGLRPDRMVFTVQKESAARMSAKPGSKSYSAFSVLCQSAYTVKAAFDLAPSLFWPQPRVNSSAVLMQVRPDPIHCAGDRRFTGFTRAAFSSRRKTLRNNLRPAGFSDEAIEEATKQLGFTPNTRAEVLSPEELAMLFDTLSTVE